MPITTDNVIKDFLESGDCPEKVKDAILCKMKQAKTLNNATHIFWSEEQDFYNKWNCKN